MGLLYLIMRSAAPLEAKFLQLFHRLFFFRGEKNTLRFAQIIFFLVVKKRLVWIQNPTPGWTKAALKSNGQKLLNILPKNGRTVANWSVSEYKRFVDDPNSFSELFALHFVWVVFNGKKEREKSRERERAQQLHTKNA